MHPLQCTQKGFSLSPKPQKIKPEIFIQMYSFKQFESILSELQAIDLDLFKLKPANVWIYACERLCLKSLAAWFQSKDTQSVFPSIQTRALWLLKKKKKSNIQSQFMLQSCLQRVLVSVTERYREFMLLFQCSCPENAGSDRRSAMLTFPNRSRWTVFCLKAWLE